MNASQQPVSRESQSLPLEELPTDAALDVLVHSNVYLMGHSAPNEESAKGIVEEGLYTAHTDLSSTVHNLETVAEDPAAADHDKALLHAWPHNDVNRYVVVLGVERLPEDTVANRYVEGIVQPRLEKGGDEEYVIGKNFVAGYFDLNEDTFTPNPDYDPQYNPRLLDTTVNLDLRKLYSGQETGPDSLAFARVGNTAVQSQTDLKNTDHIW